jgi:PmbA protein
MKNQSHIKLNEKLKSSVKARTIKNYILNSSVSSKTSIGVIGKKLGGAYRPVVTSSDFSGTLLVEWPGGLISKSEVNASWVRSFERKLKSIKKLSYRDDAAKNFLAQQKITDHTKQADNAILTEKVDINKTLISRTKDLHSWITDLKEKVPEVDANIGSSMRSFSNSKDNHLKERHTFVDISALLGQYAWMGFAERNDSKYEKKINYLKNWTEKKYRAMKKDAKRIEKKIDVILSPSKFQALFDHFILENISANAIYKRRSCYTISDFEKNKKIGPDNMTLTVTPRKEMSLGGSNFSSTGWSYPDEFKFFENGKLKAPISGHRHAKLLKISPTPPIKSFRLTNFGPIEKSIEENDFISQTDNAILITQLLGLHTQDSSTGDFSLVAPMSLIVKNGKFVGRTEVMIRGNMFDILKNIDQIYRGPLMESPYISTNRVEIIKTA